MGIAHHFVRRGEEVIDMVRDNRPDDDRSPPPRRWRGEPIHPLMEIDLFFQNEGPVPDMFRRLKAHLERLDIPHIFGATALGMHSYIRATEDVDACMRASDLATFRTELVGGVYRPVEGRSRRFRDPIADRTFDTLIAGEIAGNSRKQQSVKFPDPSEAEIRCGIPVPGLMRLIELKLVTWRYKDWGAVIELIRRNKLDEGFGQQFAPMSRSLYLQCYDQMREEDHYDAIHEQS
ncbi:MAG: hypothetical protein ACKVS9_04070 [Phycisphaerae bacterium]